MTRRTIGGPLGTQQLGQLLGHTDHRSREHAPMHALALDHARDMLRRACAALAAAEVPDPAQRAELVRMHDRLRDELVALETLGKGLT